MAASPDSQPLDGSSPAGPTECGSEDSVSSPTYTHPSPMLAYDLGLPENAGYEEISSQIWELYAPGPMDLVLGPAGPSGGLVELGDDVELDSFLNLSLSSQPDAQANNTVGLDTAPPNAYPPGPATLVVGGPVQGS